MEDDFELYTIKAVHELMEKFAEDIYSSKMAKIKLKLRFVVANNCSLISVNVDQI